METRIVVAAGGTGGHIFPAVAVVEQLTELTHGACSARFLGSESRMESKLIPQMGYNYTSMPIVGFKGILSPHTLLLPLKIYQSVRIASNVLRQHNAQAVICTGAYISYPAGVAAYKLGIPLIVLESNINPGKTNARLAPKADAVVLAFEESRKYYPESMASKLHVLGNPVRQQVLAQPLQAEARNTLGLQPNKTTLLVFGGSLGANSINAAVEGLVQTLLAKPEHDIQIVWQTGQLYQPPTEFNNVSWLVCTPFISDMGTAYSAADVVVARSGATTIAELGIVAKPAIFIPLPSASTNEQMKNARVTTAAGASILIEDSTLREDFVPAVLRLLQEKTKRNDMALAMAKFGRPTAARDVAELVLRIISTKK